MRLTASEEDMVKFKPEDATLTEANMRAVLKQFKVQPIPCYHDANDNVANDDAADDADDDGGDDGDDVGDDEQFVAGWRVDTTLEV